MKLVIKTREKLYDEALKYIKTPEISMTYWKEKYQPVDENIEWLEDFYFDLTDATQMREDLWIKVLERIKVLKGERD